MNKRIRKTIAMVLVLSMALVFNCGMVLAAVDENPAPDENATVTEQADKGLQADEELSGTGEETAAEVENVTGDGESGTEQQGENVDVDAPEVTAVTEERSAKQLEEENNNAVVKAAGKAVKAKEIKADDDTRAEEGNIIPSPVGEITIPFTKTWDDEGNESARPDSITVKLYRHKGEAYTDDDLYQTATVTADDGWKHDFVVVDSKEDPAFYYEDGEYHAYNFTIVEDSIVNYHETAHKDPSIIMGATTGDWTRITPCNYLQRTINTSSYPKSFVAIKKGNQYYIWTPEILSKIEMDILQDFVSKKQGFASITKGVQFLTGFGEDTTSGVGFVVTENTITFEKHSKWSMLGFGSYTRSTPQQNSCAITNTYYEDRGSVTVTKSFSGVDALPSDFQIKNDHNDTVFKVTSDTPGSGTTDDPYTWTLTDIPVGDTVEFTEENYDIDHYTRSGSETTITSDKVKKDENVSVAFTNDYEEIAGTGSVTVTKYFTGADALPDDFKITNDYNTGTVFDLDNTTGGSGTAADPYTWTLSDVAAGTKVKFTEENYTLDNYEREDTPTELTSDAVKKDDTVSVAFENHYDKYLGEIIVKKSFSGAEALPDDFVITNDFNEKEEFTLDNTTGGTGTADDPYTWTLEDIPVETEVTFTEANYDIKYYTRSGSDTEIKSDPVAMDELVEVNFVNEYEQETMTITVIKEWEDGDNADGIRPESVTVNLLGNGDMVPDMEPMVLSEENEWQGQWEGVPMSDEIEYTVEEETTDVITGEDGEGTYAFEVSGDAETGFIVTNTHTSTTTIDPKDDPDDPDDPTDSDKPTNSIDPKDPATPDKAPAGTRTGDDFTLSMWVSLMCISMCVLGVVMAFSRRKRNE